MGKEFVCGCGNHQVLYPPLFVVSLFGRVDLEWWLAPSLVEVEIVVYSLLCEVELVVESLQCQVIGCLAKGLPLLCEVVFVLPLVRGCIG